MAENFGNGRGRGYGPELFLDGASNIESLLDKGDDTAMQYTLNQDPKKANFHRLLEMSSVHSKIGSFHRSSLFTLNRT